MSQDLITRRLGRDVTFDDIMRISLDQHMLLAHMYNFDNFDYEDIYKKKKQESAEILVGYFNSSPDQLFELPLYDVSIGTIVSSPGGSTIFGRVTAIKSPRIIVVDIIDEDTSSGFRATKQTDKDILESMGYLECEDTRPLPSSPGRPGPSFFLGIKYDCQSQTYRIQHTVTNILGAVTELTRYDPSIKYPTFVRVRVSKSVHPWLNAEKRLYHRKNVAVFRRFQERIVRHEDHPLYYDPEHSSLIVRHLRKQWVAQQRLCRADSPPTRASADLLPEILPIMCDLGVLPQTTCRALSRTCKTFGPIVAPYHSEDPLVCCEIRREILVNAARKLRSPRQTFVHHAFAWIDSCIEYFDAHKRDGKFDMCVFDMNLMPYTTQYWMRLGIGCTTDQVTVLKKVRDKTIVGGWEHGIGFGHVCYGLLQDENVVALIGQNHARRVSFGLYTDVCETVGNYTCKYRAVQDEDYFTVHHDRSDSHLSYYIQTMLAYIDFKM